MRPVEAFEQQARACAALGSPMYAELLDRLAEDIDANGPTATVIAGHEDDPGPSALALRLLGSVHRLVLERRAGELAAYYPSVGGTWEPDRGHGGVPAAAGRAGRRRSRVARPAAADQRGRPGDGADGRAAAPVDDGAPPGAPLRDRVVGRAEPARPTGSPSSTTSARCSAILPRPCGSIPPGARRRCSRGPGWSSSSASAATRCRSTPPRRRAGWPSRRTCGPTSSTGSSGCAEPSTWLGRRRRACSEWAPLTSSTASSCSREPRRCSGTA